VRNDFYRKVWSSIWREPWTDDVRTVAFYLLTGEHSSNEGIYRMPLAYAPPDLGWTPKRFQAAFDELARIGFVEHDSETHIVLVCNALKRNKPNDNQIKSIVNALREFPDTPLLARFQALAVDHSKALAKALHEDSPQRFPLND
jgi:hypothetical protein